MIILFAVFVCLCLYGIQLKPANGESYITDYMSVDKTSSIKGIFIIIVFFSHFNSYVEYTSAGDIAYLDAFSKIGQRMVTLFMFYSGYGVMESIKKKQMTYVKKIPVNRFLGTLFRFDAAILIFLVIYLARGLELSAKQLVLSFVGWDSVGNSNWYIFAILVCYAITYVAFMIFKDKGKYFPAAIAVTLGAMAYIVVLGGFGLKGAYWFDTIMLYPCGIFWSLLKDKLEKIININDTMWLFSFVVATAAAYITWQLKNDSLVFNLLGNMLFALAVVLFTMRVSLNNKVLRWCGKNLFGLYILQRIPMIIFREVGLADCNIYLYFIICLVVTVIIAWLFEKYIGKLWKLIISPRKKADVKSA
ncbi:MAG: acyltransferase family protein [Clostridia bacterium]|nr:acyltransferase family protein [Clostridia bacterium]